MCVQDAVEDIKKVIGAISKLKNELVTNKPILPLVSITNDDTFDDIIHWNSKLDAFKELRNETQTWFNSVWLFCECYMYRRIVQEFALT